MTLELISKPTLVGKDFEIYPEAHTHVRATRGPCLEGMKGVTGSRVSLFYPRKPFSVRTVGEKLKLVSKWKTACESCDKISFLLFSHLWNMAPLIN